MRKLLTNIINPLSDTRAEFLPQRIISLEGSMIAAIEPLDPALHHDYEDFSDCLALPGFIDIHVHLSQYLMRGLYEPALLPWLTKHVFPAEARSNDPEYAAEIARLFYEAQLACGTTMSVIYTAPYPEACETAFITAAAMGLRALIGMTMMDQNSPQELRMTTKKALTTSIELYERWHGKSPMRDYIFTPRFAPSCSMELMTEIARYASTNKAWMQTHLSENHDEIALVKQLFGLSSYTDVYAQAGMLGPRSIFGHALHLGDDELRALQESGSKTAHCPDSNFYLKSGEFPLERIEANGIPFALGSDVGAGTTLNMLHHARMMNFRQSSYSVSPENALYHITLGSAKLLEMGEHLGSLEPGKDADMVILQPPEGYQPSPESPSQLIFFGTEFKVKETMVAGTTRYHAHP